MRLPANTGRQLQLRSKPESGHPAETAELAVCIRCGSFKRTTGRVALTRQGWQRRFWQPNPEYRKTNRDERT